MADNEEPDETLAELQASDWEIPGIPDDSVSPVNASKTSSKMSKTSSKMSKTSSKMSKTSSKMSKIQSLASTVQQNGSRSASASVHQEDEPSAQPSAEPSRQSHQEESSKSQEELKQSQELPLNGKQTSLDQLSKDTSQTSQKPRATRLHRQCQRRFRELIGKRELKNEELEKQQGDLKQRLNILECSMPAVMVWNIWRMSQGAGVPSIKRVLEKQFQGPASGEVYCPSTPSRHFDCRVREVEAERKQAQKRAEEARSLWTEKASALEEKNKKLEEAREVQKQIRENIEKLKVEAQMLREAAANQVKDDGACESGECGVIECKKKWLEKVPSSASIKSTDIECLEKLQMLAETELCMKKQIADLERREEAYMRTLQQADELWSKLQGDAASTVSALQEQLDVKTAANQQMADRIVQLEDVLEQLRTRMANCRNELEKYMSIGKIEALIGRDDDFADVTDREASTEVLQRHRKVGSGDDITTVDEKSVLSKEQLLEKDIAAKPGAEDAQLGIKPGDVSYEQQRLEEAKGYLASYESLSELFADDDYICPPDFTCNDQVFTETGLTEEEMTALKEGRVTAEMLLEKLNKGIDESAKLLGESGEVPASMMRTIKRTEGAEETVEQPAEVEEEEMIVVNEIAVESDRKIDDEEETPVTALEETEIDAVEEAFIEAPGEEEIVEGIDTKDETEDYTSFKDAVDEDNILVPRDELIHWLGNVDTVRGTIEKCPDCVVVKKDADEVAEMIARHIGMPMEEVIDERKEREDEEPRVVEQVSAAEVEVQREVELEVKEDEEITAPPAEYEEVPVVIEDVAAPLITKDVEDVGDVTIQEVAVVEAPPSEKPAIATPTASVMEEVGKEASKASIPEVASPVKESAPPAPPKEDIPPLMEEVAPVADEKGPEEVQEVTVEPVTTDVVPTAVKEETVTPVAVDEAKETPVVERAEAFEAPTEDKVLEVEVVEVQDGLPVKEVPPFAEEKAEVAEVASPEEKEPDVTVLPTTEKEEPEVIEVKVLTEKEEEEVLAPKEDETETRVLPEGDEEMVTAQKKEIEVDLLPEKEEKEAPKEEIVVVDTVQEEVPEEVVVEIVPEKEEIAVELQPVEEGEEIPLKEDVVELLPTEKEEEVPPKEDVVELLPEEKVEEMAVELLPEEREEEAPKEEEIEMEMVSEKEEISEPKEEEREEEAEAEPPTEEAEEVTVLEVAVLPEEEVEIEVEKIPVPGEEVEEEPTEEVVEVPVSDEIEETPEAVVSEEVITRPCTCFPTAEVSEASLAVSEEIEVPVEVYTEEVPAEVYTEEVPLEVYTEEVPVEVYTEEVPTEEVPEAVISEEVITRPCTCFPTPEVSEASLAVSEEIEVPIEEVPEAVVSEEVITRPCICSSTPEISEASGPEEIATPPCVCSSTPDVPEAPASEEMGGRPCVCSSPPEASEAPAPEEMATPPCVCSSTPDVSEAPAPDPCVCSSTPEVSEAAATLPCVCSSTPEVSEAPAPDPCVCSSTPEVSEAAATLPCVCSSTPEVSEAPAPAPCVCSSTPAVSEAPAPDPCVCSSTPAVSEAPAPEEMARLPCVCSSIPEVPEAPDPKEMATPPCVCFPEPEMPKAPAPEETHPYPCTCSTPEQSTPVVSKAAALAAMYELCTCSTTPEGSARKVSAPGVPNPEVSLEPSTKIEITQTEYTTTIESVQVVTQTVSDMGTQTPPLNRLLRCCQQPKIITITRPMDPELDILSQLTQRLKPITEPSLTITTTASVQTEKSSLFQVKAAYVDSRPPSLRISEMLQSLKAEVAHLNGSPRSDQEQELKTINYGKKPRESEMGKCNCCMCGKDVLSNASVDAKARTQRQSSTMFRILPPTSTMQRSTVPGIHRGVQHETICPECKIRKRQKSQSSKESFRCVREEKKPTRDKEVCACVSFTPKGIPFSKLKKKIDQSCTARISKTCPKVEKPLKRDKVDCVKEVQEIMPATKAEDKESLMHCICSTEMETGEPGVVNRVRCACGDPD